jgi:hypothetical protein
MLEDVGIVVVMMELVMNDAGFFERAKTVYAACSQQRV